MGSTDLTSFLPARNRDKTIDTLIKNLFNRHLSKSDIVTLFGCNQGGTYQPSKEES